MEIWGISPLWLLGITLLWTFTDKCSVVISLERMLRSGIAGLCGDTTANILWKYQTIFQNGPVAAIKAADSPLDGGGGCWGPGEELSLGQNFLTQAL